MRWKNITFFLVFAAFVILLRSGTFIVYEGRQVVLTQFGRIVGKNYQKPGLYFRIPFIQKVNEFEARLLTWKGIADFIPSKDKLYISVETVAHWKIKDPAKFIETLTDIKTAEDRLASIINGSVREIISKNRLVDAVRNTDKIISQREIEIKNFFGTNSYASTSNEKNEENEEELEEKLEEITLGRSNIIKKMIEMSEAELNPVGIQLVNILIKDIKYEPSVETMVYERMISERSRMSEHLLSTGRSETERIRGDIAQDYQNIIAPAIKAAEQIKGDADAFAVQVYAKAYEKDRDFYNFWRNLEALKTTLPKQSQMILSPDSSFLKPLKKPQQEIPAK